MDTVQAQYELACTDVVLFDLSTHAKIELTGAEARSFLHNLCTNDIKNLPDGGGCEAFFTTPKARVVGHVFIAARQDKLRLDALPGQNDTLVGHLNHYIVSEQVEVTDFTTTWSMRRLVGPSAQAVLERALGCNLAGMKHLDSRAVSLGGETEGYVRRFDSLSLPAFDLFAPASAALPKLEVPVASQELHDILRVEAGLPAFGVDIDENRLVMEVGRTAQAISYAKGCFLGQEPIVMARDRGQVNRMLVGVTLEGAPLPRGARLYKGDVEVGQAMSSLLSPRLGRTIALAYLKRGHQEPGTQVTIEPATDGRTATVATLPFVSA